MTNEQAYAIMTQASSQLTASKSDTGELIKHLEENSYDKYYDPEDDEIKNFKLERFFRVLGQTLYYCEFDSRLAEQRIKKGLIKEARELCAESGDEFEDLEFYYRISSVDLFSNQIMINLHYPNKIEQFIKDVITSESSEKFKHYIREVFPGRTYKRFKNPKT